MKIAILGAGNVGGTLGKALTQAGHQIVFGARDPDSPKTRAVVDSLGGSAQAVSVPEAVAQSDVVFLTTPWEATQGILQEGEKWDGKTLIDVTNPIAMGAEGLKQGLLVGHTTSGGEQVAQWAPGAHIVKAFNTTGYPNMADPKYDGAPTTMFFCGDDEGAKKIVAQLGETLGFEMVDAGALQNARLLEPFAMLWIDLALHQGMGVNFAFKILKR